MRHVRVHVATVKSHELTVTYKCKLDDGPSFPHDPRPSLCPACRFTRQKRIPSKIVATRCIFAEASVSWQSTGNTSELLFLSYFPICTFNR